MDAVERKVVVIGAGPAGLACAVSLVDQGVTATVVEASPFVGGLARSFDLWGQTVDLGPHRFFSHHPAAVALWRRFVGEDFTMVRRQTRILYGDQLVRYPLEAGDALARLRKRDVLRALASYGRRRIRPIADPQSFEDWVVNRFGDHLYGAFFRDYTRKVWGIEGSELDAAWAASRIKGLSLTEALRAAVVGDKAHRHETLVDTFAYPSGGSGVPYERMAAHIAARGGEVRLSSSVRRIHRGPGGEVTGVELESGEVLAASQVVSTMPLTRMVEGLGPAPRDVELAAKALSWRNTVLVYVEIDAPALFPDNWVYVHRPDLAVGRITNFRNWGPGLARGASTTILCLELWASDEDPLWKEPPDGLGALGRSELAATGLIGSATILRSQVHKIRRSYPVYRRGYTDHLSRLQDHVDGVPGLIAIGRGGAFKYNNQDHSLLMGLAAAAQVVTGRPQGLWALDAESTYQESAEFRAMFGSS